MYVGRTCVRDVAAEDECGAERRREHRRRIAARDRLRLREAPDLLLLVTSDFILTYCACKRRRMYFS